MAEAAEKKDPPQLDLPRYQPLVIVLVAVCAGIVADRFWPLPMSVWWAVAVGAWAVWLGLWHYGRPRTAAVVLLIAIAATAGSWHHGRWYLFAENDLGHYARTERQPICVEAIALKSPRLVPAPKPDPMRAIPQGDRSRLEVKLVALRNGIDWEALSGRARMTVSGYLADVQSDVQLDVQSGDRLRIFAQLSALAGPQNPGAFDYAEFNRADRRRGRLFAQFPECVSVLKRGYGWSLWRLIDRARTYGRRLLDQHLDYRRSPLAAAVLLGAREDLDPEQTRAFMQTGTIHLLAISGLHVGILTGALLFVMLRLPIPRGPALLSVAAMTVFYMLLTDARPPVIRATILVLVSCCALYLRRRPLSFNSLAAAALVVLAWNPADLFNTGFQLSFLAVAALMWFGPNWIYSVRDLDPLNRLIAESRGWLPWLIWGGGKMVRRLTLVGVTIWLLTMPLVMARFHLLTPIAPLLNTLLWLPMAVGLMAGFGTLVLGTLADPLGHVCGVFCDASMYLLQLAVSLTKDIPLSHFWVPGPADWWLIGLYGTLGLWAVFPRVRPPRRWCLACLAAWMTVGLAPAALRQEDPRLQCTFLSVGHGCAVVLQLPSGQTMLYDAGQIASPVAGSRSIAGFLWSQGITHLDAVVLSHGDLDHYNALPRLLDQFSVGVIYISPMMFQEGNPALTALQQAIGDSGVRLGEVYAGDRLDVRKACRIEVLHPPKSGVLGGDNANSIVLQVEHLGRRILLPGDLDSPGLDDVLAEEPLDCDVLLAPHHGSRRSNPPGLAAWCTPEWVIVSGGRRPDLAPMEATYQATGSRVLSTATTGAVTVRIDPAGVKVDPFLPPPL